MGKYTRALRRSAEADAKLEVIKAKHAAQQRLVKEQERKKRDALILRVGTKLKEMFYGGKTYAKKRFPPSGGSAAARGEVKKRTATTVTKKIVRGLKQAGVSDKKIKQLRD